MQATFFESTTTQKKLADIGRAMMDWSENYGRKQGLRDVTDNGLRTLNEMSHVGNMLTKIGVTFGVTVQDFTDEDRALIVGFINNKLTIERKD